MGIDVDFVRLCMNSSIVEVIEFEVCAGCLAGISHLPVLVTFVCLWLIIPFLQEKTSETECLFCRGHHCDHFDV